MALTNKMGLTPSGRSSIIALVRGTPGREHGFTLVELLVVISAIGILLAFLMPRMIAQVTKSAKSTATLRELQLLREAIVGDPSLVVEGQYVKPGFKNDVGRYPRHLVELATSNPFQGIYERIEYPGKETLGLYDPITRHGWNGPYIAEDGNFGYLYDAWGNQYQFYTEGLDTLGLKSAGPDGLFYGQPGALTDDDIKVRF